MWRNLEAAGWGFYDVIGPEQRCIPVSCNRWLHLATRKIIILLERDIHRARATFARLMVLVTE